MQTNLKGKIYWNKHYYQDWSKIWYTGFSIQVGNPENLNSMRSKLPPIFSETNNIRVKINLPLATCLAVLTVFFKTYQNPWVHDACLGVYILHVARLLRLFLSLEHFISKIVWPKLTILHHQNRTMKKIRKSNCSCFIKLAW